MNRKPQTVSLTWLPYPENKPKKEGRYVVSIHVIILGKKPFDFIDIIYYHGGDIKWFGMGDSVKAFAEIPQEYLDNYYMKKLKDMPPHDFKKLYEGNWSNAKEEKNDK